MTFAEFWGAMKVYLLEKGVDLEAQAREEEKYQKMLEKHGQPTASIRNG